MTVLPAALRRVGVLTALCLALGIAQSAYAEMYDMPPEGSDVVGKLQHIHTKASDTFVALARRYDVGYRELRLANPNVDPWLPGDGTPLVVPTRYVLPDAPRKGVVINLPEMRLYFYPPANSEYAGKVFTFPIGIGREGWSTPLGETKISQKIPNPTWTPPASIKAEHAKNGDPLPDVVAAGPDNPLGQYALRLALPSYLIHGTNKPAGIGMKVSHGCIRLFPDDIKKLFSMASVGMPVDIVSQPYKIGWDSDHLVMEAHPPDADGDAPVKSYTPWVQELIAATEDRPKTPVDWHVAESVARQADGIPEPIGGPDAAVRDAHPAADDPAADTSNSESDEGSDAQTGNADPYAQG
ncbi:L,D-transpeptidase family protein [Salinisphaera sp. Q1T1-3]|uniref:L,D-transpeptidase family protein n=1 Tax=Salinisphaera sp. Q1T1-3 TaxID=2321229 RepID=UPI000E750D9C|nr:L,D-transpeptidase family protein [Salinisphaera sp. Q1T1-3]RJS93316.1 L,D-transpeptidase [Salinisphaera sp. Q1T1-3]